MQKTPAWRAGVLEQNEKKSSSFLYDQNPATSIFPPGLVGGIAQFILNAAPRPVPEIALVGAIGLLAGITGRAYNVSRTGLNQYLLLVAKTGRGKEAIASGISKLMCEVAARAPCAKELQGPTEIASPQALLKWLSRSPCIYSIVGEFGMKLQEMSAPKASLNVSGTKRTLLDLYNKSGKGDVLGAMAYAKREDNTPVINSPSFTLIGETTPETLYETVSDVMVSNGLLSRFSVTEYNGQRVPLSKTHGDAFPTNELVTQLADLCAHCESICGTGQVQNVGLSENALVTLDNFNNYCDRQINDNPDSELFCELWNRAHLKALKLAAVCAVGCNPYHPCITVEQANWATGEIWVQTKALIKKFSNDEIGIIAGSETKQLKSVERVIGEYATEPFEKHEMYGGTFEMHRDHVISASHIQRRVINTAPFKGVGGGARAVNNALKRMIDGDELKEINKTQMQQRYGTTARAFAISNGKFILDALAA